MDDNTLANVLNAVGDVVAHSKSLASHGYKHDAQVRLIHKQASLAYNLLINEEMNRADNCFPDEPVFEPEWMAEDTQLHLEHISNLTRDEEARALPEPVQVFWL